MEGKEEDNPKKTGNKLAVKRCPNCQAITKIYDSRDKEEIGYVRYRYCPNCHITYKTIEIPYKTLEELTACAESQKENII